MTKYQLRVYLKYKAHELSRDMRKTTSSYFYISMFWLVVALIAMSRGIQWLGLGSIVVSFLILVLWDIQKGRHIGWVRKQRS